MAAKTGTVKGRKQIKETGMEPIVIPGWVLSNIGGFVGFGILSLVLLGAQARRKKRREQKRRDREQEERERRDRELRTQQQIKKERDQELRDKELLLELLLPGPWRTLYELLRGCSKMTKQGILLTATTFKDAFGDIPKICPRGFDLILGVSYYNLGPGRVKGQGSCHSEFVNLLSDYVEFPKNS